MDSTYVPPVLPKRFQNIYAEPYSKTQQRHGTIHHSYYHQQNTLPNSNNNNNNNSINNDPVLSHNQTNAASTFMLPNFPLRPINSTHTANLASYSPSRFEIDKSCKKQFSWKCFSIVLVIVAFILAALLAYFAIYFSAITSSIATNLDQNNCMLVQDMKTYEFDQSAKNNQLSTDQSINDDNIPTAAGPSAVAIGGAAASVISENFNATTKHISDHQQLFQEQYQDQQQQQQQQQQTLTLELNKPYLISIEPESYRRFQYDNKFDKFFNFNLTVANGNFLFCGRRNGQPTVTRHDFFYFVQNGKLEVLSSSSSSRPNLRKKRNVSSEKNFNTNNNNVANWQNQSFGHVLIKRDINLDDNIVVKQVPINISILEYLDVGKWNFAIFNDELFANSIAISFGSMDGGFQFSCPNECSERGRCVSGRCACEDGYRGDDCSKNICPILCSSNGRYSGGLCHCNAGWKGIECDVPENECEKSDCSSHGKCLQGICECDAGWTGKNCDRIDCIDPKCSNRGICQDGKCYCKAGWHGDSCQNVDEKIQKCLPSCSGNGAFDLDSRKCICNAPWTGSNCSKSLCNLDCGPHGICDLAKCVCDSGWTGTKCDKISCDHRCHEHGQCKNGTCVCSQGWNGRYCTLPGCENGCSKHGQCSLDDGTYRCVCNKGWDGHDCSVQLELECDDEIDNDNDGLTDCYDVECCNHPSCNGHIMCLVSNDPIEVLLRKQPPSVTASFYQRMKFLIEENSVQSYAHLDEYTERRVAVMRGQVISTKGAGVLGVRVSVLNTPKLGFTVTREGGWYDILVNGGGAVTLQFQKSSLKSESYTMFVPWNRIIVLPTILMTSNLEKDRNPNNVELLRNLRNKYMIANSVENNQTCSYHDNKLSIPSIIGSNHLLSSLIRTSNDQCKSSVLVESQILQECVKVPGTKLNLIYQSSKAAGYLSILRVKLTNTRIAKNLKLIHVRVEIEGSVNSHVYEADPNLIHTFAWNKRNVYKQKVYGLAIAKISIGYEYSRCDHIVWEIQTARLQGYEVDISDLGGWGVEIHHHYNFNEGILQKGDGSSMRLKDFPRIVEVLMGTGLQRTFDCVDGCDNGKARDAQLLTPVALASGPDGSLYVGDFNLIRRITPDGNVYTVLKLNASQVVYQYYLAVSPVNGHLYISDPEKHQILKVLILEPAQDLFLNSEVVIGNGEKCIPGDENLCGDGDLAVKARLAYPKGIVISADGIVYIADGTNIRFVDRNGIIRTLIGHHGHRNYWDPIPCDGSILASKLQLQWPTAIDLNPLDGTLYFIDGSLVMKVTNDRKVKLVAGVPLHCNVKTSKFDNLTTTSAENLYLDKQVLGTVAAMSFSSDGDLYLAEIDSKKSNTIRVLTSDGKLSSFAGKKPESNAKNRKNCNCKKNQTNCDCTMTGNGDRSDTENANFEIQLASNMQFQSISAISVSADGILTIADQETYHILALKHYISTHNENGEFSVPNSLLDEIYVFNRYGQHIATRDLVTGHVKYSFLYSKNTSFGKLASITDSLGNKIQFVRDYSNVVSGIETSQNRKFDLKISALGNLIELSEKDLLKIEFNYDSSNGLLISRTQDDKSFIYEYNWLGRVIKSVLSTGEIVSFDSNIDQSNLFNVKNDYYNFQINNMDDSKTIFQLKSIETGGLPSGSCIEAINYRNNTLQIARENFGQIVNTGYEKHPLLEAQLPIEAELFPVRSRQQTIFGDGLRNRLTIGHKLIGDVKNTLQTLQRELIVNGSRALIIQYDQATNKEIVSSADREAILTVQYNKNGLPLFYVPNDSTGEMVQLSYDRFNRLEAWKWGKFESKYSYNQQGLLTDIQNGPDGIQSLAYNSLSLLSKISLASQRDFLLFYDDYGGLRHVQLPRGTKHSFSLQTSIGFFRVSYTAPGTNKSYLQHFSFSGLLLQTIFPGDNAKILYRYDNENRIRAVVYGRTLINYKYSPSTKCLTEITLNQDDLEYRWSYNYIGGLLYEIRLDFGSKFGLSGAKFIYDYDNNYRIVNLHGRIGGQTLQSFNYDYNSKTGTFNLIGNFEIQSGKNNANLTILSDKIATFQRIVNKFYLVKKVTINIHKIEVFRMEFNYDNKGRISQTRTYTRNIGINTYINVKNYTWDSDGQLIGVESQEPWGFRYDDNGNMLSLTYRGNIIPMEYNSMDRIVKFGEGFYKYDSRGSVIQNARDERFVYNAKGLLIRAFKKGRFDVHYFYDHYDRLIVRKDNFGNVTQFFYTNVNRLQEITHIYSPKDGKLVTLVYDDKEHLIYAQIYKNKYYIATDHCGTPIMIFNNYGESVREIMRSPYGHIVYDSNPYLYLPIDFCGGLLDQVTSLVHMKNGKVYDPLIGQWMTPVWENIFDKVQKPTQLHLYRYNGNDPVNNKPITIPLDHSKWFDLMNRNMRNIVPQLYPEQLPDAIYQKTKHFRESTIVNVPGSIIETVRKQFQDFGFLTETQSFVKLLRFEDLLAAKKSAVLVEQPRLQIGREPELLFDRGIIVSKLSNNRISISNAAAANPIYRDVYVSVLNDTKLVPFVLNSHQMQQQDLFYFVKEDQWKFSDDKMQLKRLQGHVNSTFNNRNQTASESAGSAAAATGGGPDAHIHGDYTELNIRYGTSLWKEIQRISHHAKIALLRRVWHREKDLLKNGFFGTFDWSNSEFDEISKIGYLDSYDVDYYQNVTIYPELIEDVFAAVFVKKSKRFGSKDYRRKSSFAALNMTSSS